MAVFATAAAVGTLLNVAANLDFTQSAAFLTVELLKRLLFGCALVVGASVAALRSMSRPEPDDRPAPWVLYAMLAALASFLVHNLIEFSLFETGPLMLFALVAGTALGVRQPTAAGHKRRTPVAVGFLLASVAAWAAAAAFFVLPTAAAESLARRADDDLRAGQAAKASGEYLDAYLNHQRLDADYAYRAATALTYDPRHDRATARDRLTLAIARDPSQASYYLARARVDEEVRDRAAVRADYEKALALNPNDVTFHLEYADALRRLDLPGEAAAQYEEALKYNHLLPAEEPRRMNDAVIRAGSAAALARAGRPADAAAQARRALDDNAAFPLGDPRRLTPAQVDEIRKMAQ